MLLAFADAQSGGINFNKLQFLSSGTPTSNRAQSSMAFLRPENISKYTIQTENLICGHMLKTV